MLRELHSACFEDLDEDTLRLLDPLLEYYTCQAGSVIFEQGEPAHFLYILLRGTVVLRYKPYDGPPINLIQIQPGGVFGWSSVIGNPNYTSGAIAREEVEAIRLRGVYLRRLAMHHPKAGQVILDRLARRVSNRWEDATLQVRAILEEAVSAHEKGVKGMTNINGHSKEQQLRSLVENLSAYIEQFHGGSVEFVSLEGNRLTVRLGGACLGCPLLPSTLHGWVAGTVRQFFPDIEVVAAEA